MKKNRQDIIKKIACELQMPENALHDAFVIRFTSHTSVSVEGCKGIIEYSGGRVKLNLGSKTVLFEGESLELSSFFDSDVTISGDIFSMSFA